MPAVLFLICLAIGAIAGPRGGVIIKPVLDLFYLLPLSTVSFCSGYTVLDMSICSLIRTRSNGVKLELRTSTPLRGAQYWAGLWGNVSSNWSATDLAVKMFLVQSRQSFSQSSPSVCFSMSDIKS